MELIINIDEDVRIAITRMGLLRIPDEMQKKVDKAIQHGKPLPKGHGRLVDADAILEEPFGNTYRDINIAETIIEADKENEKDEHMTADEFVELFTERDKE